MLSNVLFILLGAGLVSVGFLVAAFAERIRGPRETEPYKTRRGQRTIPVVEAVEVFHPTAAPPPTAAQASRTAAAPASRSARAETKNVTSSEGGEDVISALAAAGYKKALATEATWACTVAERSTIEGWTAAALRRCARGGLA